MADFEPKAFLELASQITSQYKTQAAYRCAIGRAYYACFLTGRDCLSKKGWFDPSESAHDHSAVRRALTERGLTSIAFKLRGLMEIRRTRRLSHDTDPFL